VRSAPIGILGGTFNPVHFGHLRSAVELREHLELGEVRLMPAAQPPHRSAPDCSAEQRAAMVCAAIAGEQGLQCDRRELQRPGPSYTIDSLEEIRAEEGPDASVCLIIGADALLGLDRWHRWRELTRYAHLIVIARPGWELTARGAVLEFVEEHRCDDASQLRQHPAGCLLLERLRPLDISATEIRDLVANGRSARYLVPDAVWETIQSNGLYLETAET
jgi:nicotinate-nucleotide adenylyltransferase